MNLLSLPEKFWHCAVTLCKGESGECAVVNDLEKDKLLREIVEPWHAHRAFKVGWFVVTSREMVAQIKITHTEQPVSFYHDQHYESTRQSGIVDTVTNTGYIPIETG